MFLFRNKWTKIPLFLGLALLLVVFVCHFIIEIYASKKTYNDTNNIPKNKVGLLLGTAKYLINGGINPYFKYRINAAVSLYKAKKIDFILISGDNGQISYNEPIAFKKSLIENGIPENKIFLDYAGFSTLDSVLRAQAIFGQQSFTIISQEFHNERAIYLANMHGMQTIGYNAKNVNTRFGIKVILREYLARTKVFLNLALGTGPKFLGEKILIE